MFNLFNACPHLPHLSILGVKPKMQNNFILKVEIIKSLFLFNLSIIYNVFRNYEEGVVFPLIEEGNSFIPVRETKYKENDIYCGTIWFNKSQFQLDLDTKSDELRDYIKTINPLEVTPIEALVILDKIKYSPSCRML